MDYYDGPVCYQDGWHYTVVDDPDARERARATAQAHLDYAKKRLGPDEVAANEAELAHVEERDFHAPGERLVLEDRYVTPDGEPYDGVVVLVDGAEHSAAETPLPLSVEHRYRLATDADERSWHDRKHRVFSTVTLEDGSAGLHVTPEELKAIETFVGKLREEGGQR